MTRNNKRAGLENPSGATSAAVGCFLTGKEGEDQKADAAAATFLSIDVCCVNPTCPKYVKHIKRIPSEVLFLNLDVLLRRRRGENE